MFSVSTSFCAISKLQHRQTLRLGIKALWQRERKHLLCRVVADVRRVVDLIDDFLLLFFGVIVSLGSLLRGLSLPLPLSFSTHVLLQSNTGVLVLLFKPSKQAVTTTG